MFLSKSSRPSFQLYRNPLEKGRFKIGGLTVGSLEKKKGYVSVNLTNRDNKFKTQYHEVKNGSVEKFTEVFEFTALGFFENVLFEVVYVENQKDKDKPSKEKKLRSVGDHSVGHWW
eukprot:TRINITY_DN8986_c0_g1_i1.p1 TRINITY_DN8986_c0_g1~~TRINITY_DN8986_c0_g1_i1.p1  ORF type:complete len:116 (-),score=27.66 TRINITY_DN8986_c0_g1_i1:153-500(-)